ncbi:hypothetical protein AB1K18_21565 [Peribacillus simplex]|uniref:hypothetical protein n=1 Tax=Peribacillus simplex TaxID=1478 RepID=UPI003B8C7FF9
MIGSVGLDVAKEESQVRWIRTEEPFNRHNQLTKPLIIKWKYSSHATFPLKRLI